MPRAAAAIASRCKRALLRAGAGDSVLALAMVALVVYYAVQRGVFQGKASGDGWFGFQYLRSLVYFHTLDMKDAVPEYLAYFGRIGPGQHMPNRCPFGPVFVWMPLYLVACAVQTLLELVHLVTPAHGQSPFEMWFTGLGTLAGVLVGWRQTYVLVERHLGRGAARIGAIAAVWATPIAWYAVTQPFYQHGLAFCFVALLVERWDKERGSPATSRMLTLGALGGAAMMMRPQEVLWLLLPAGEIGWRLVRDRGDRARWLRAGVVLAAAAAIVFAPQAAVWFYYTGGVHPAEAEPLRLATPFFSVSLFSTRGGLFSWSPVTYAAALGLVFYKPARTPALALFAVFALEVYVVASAWVLTGGYGYGARRLSDGAPLIALGVGLLWKRVEAGRVWRRVLAGFVAFCVVANLAMMELLRWKAIPSAGAYARSAERLLSDLGAPPPLSRFFGAVGYPFVQPLGWMFALRYGVAASAFENVVGNWFLDRDGQWFRVQTPTLTFDKGGNGFVMSGLALQDRPPATVTGPVRLLLPMFQKERISVRIVGNLLPGAAEASWNGAGVPVTREPGALRLVVAPELVHPGVNDFRFTLPLGSTLTRIDFAPLP